MVIFLVMRDQQMYYYQNFEIRRNHILLEKKNLEKDSAQIKTEDERKIIKSDL